MAASLQITTTSGSSKVFIQSAKLVVGSGAESDIKLEDPKVAKAHCAIVKTGEGYSIMNLAGQAGTFVNGKPVTRAALKQGDVVTLGGSRIVFNADGAPGGGTAPVAKAATGPVKRPSPTGSSPSAKTIPMKAASAGGSGTQTMARPTGRTPSAKVARATGTVAKPATERRPTGPSRRPADKRRDKAVNKYLHGKKKAVWPAVLLVAAVMGVMIGVGMYFAPRSGGDEAKKALEGAKKLSQEASRLQDEGKLTEALAEITQAMKRAEEAGEEGALTLASLKKDKEAIESLIVTAKNAQVEFDAIKVQFEKGIQPNDLDAFKSTLGGLQVKYKESEKICPWMGTLKGYLVQIDLQIKQRDENDRPTWASFKEKTVDPLMTAAKFAEARSKVEGALADFRVNDKKQANAFVERLPRAAETWWQDTGTKKLRSFQRESNFEAAQKALEEALPNVLGMPVEATIRGVLELVKQKKWPGEVEQPEK